MITEIPKLKRGLLLLAVALCSANCIYAENSGRIQAGANDQRAGVNLLEPQSLPETVEPSDFERALMNQVHNDFGLRVPAPPKQSQSNLVWVIVIILAGGVCLRKLAPELKAMLGTSLDSGTVV